MGKGRILHSHSRCAGDCWAESAFDVLVRSKRDTEATRAADSQVYAEYSVVLVEYVT